MGFFEGPRGPGLERREGSYRPLIAQEQPQQSQLIASLAFHRYGIKDINQTQRVTLILENRPKSNPKQTLPSLLTGTPQ